MVEVSHKKRDNLPKPGPYVVLFGRKKNASTDHEPIVVWAAYKEKDLMHLDLRDLGLNLSPAFSSVSLQSCRVYRLGSFVNKITMHG